MSTDYVIVCIDCKAECGEMFASRSIAYGFKVWDHTPEARAWLAAHESHALRIVSEHIARDLSEEWEKP
jgi:hypothetical protein